MADKILNVNVLVLGFLNILVATKLTQAIQKSADNYWRFDLSTGYTDAITNVKASYHGNSGDISNQVYRHGNGFLRINSTNSSLQLNGLATSCLFKPSTCNEGVTMAMWFLSNPSSSDEFTYFTSESNRFSLMRLKNGSLAVQVVDENTTHEIQFSLNVSHWTHLTITWDLTMGITMYANSQKVHQTSTVIRTAFINHTHTQSPRHYSLLLFGDASYDDVMIWSKTLSSVEIKKIFQSQISSILNATCHAQATSLNITWQNSLDVYSAITSYHARLRQERMGKTLSNYRLPKAAIGVLFKDLSPITNYRIKIWAQTQDNNAIKTQVIKCRTLEGVPEQVVNLMATPRSSSTVFLQWIPPFRINGFLKGYQVNVSNGPFKDNVIVAGKQSLLIQRLNESTVYDIKVAAINGRAMGSTSTVTIKTKEIPIIKSRPNGLTVVAVHWNSIHIKWLPMEISHEVEVYEIRLCRDNEELFCKYKTTNATSISLIKLHQNTRYQVSIRAVNKRSQGPWTRQKIRTSDRNECITNAHTCSQNALCHNTPGSFLCICLPGYASNGSQCTNFEDNWDIVCPYQILDSLSWYSVFKGQHARILCPKGTVGITKRYCDEIKRKAVWNTPNLERCTSQRLIKIQEKLSNERLNSSLLVDLVSDLVAATRVKSSLPMYGGDIKATLSILKQLDAFTAKNPSKMDETSQRQFSLSTVHISSNILDDSRMLSWNGIPKKSRISIAYQLVDTLESITLATSSYVATQGPVIQTAPNIVVNMQSFPAGDYDTQFSVTSIENYSINLPVGEVGRFHTGNKTQVCFVYLSNIGRLLSPSNRNQTTSHEVVSLSTSPKFTGTFQEPVVISLRTPQHSDNMEVSCVFWNSTSVTPSWSSQGCSVYSTNSTFTVCHCNHLTSFAVLMQYVHSTSPQMEIQHKFALSLITHIGIGVSLVALLMAFITFCVCPFLQSTRNFAHINLTLSLLLAEGLFLVGINKTTYILPCQIIAVTLHYLFLVVFCWMASEGIILYFMLVRVFPTESSGPRRRLFFICSWGLPCIFVVLSFSLYPQGYANGQHCWLTIEDGFIWSFLAPVIAISVVNLVFLIMTFKVMANRLTPQAVTKRKTFRHWVKACGVLSCLLGTTWLLGLFYVNKSSLVIAYIFNVFNSLQGLLIFVFHCVFDDRVRAEYCRILCCRGSRRDYLRKQSTEPVTSRKLTPVTCRQKYVQCSTEDKGTISGLTTSLEKNDLGSTQDVLQGFDSDSLLTINKTSTEEYGATDVVLETQNRNQARYKCEKNHPSKRQSCPLSLDISSKSLRRSKEYYSDSECANYFSDALSYETSRSNNDIGSHPTIQTAKGHVVKLGRCKICSNDCYHMVCIGNEDEFTLDSFESAEPISLQYHTESTDEPATFSCRTFSRTRNSFDDSILTGFLRDEHPNPNIITHRWTHIPYMKEKDIQTKEFLSESTSCDDRFLRTQQEENNGLKDRQETFEELQCSDRPNHDKPIGLVSPIIMISPLSDHYRGDERFAPVASVESIGEMNVCDGNLEQNNESDKNTNGPIEVDQDNDANQDQRSSMHMDDSPNKCPLAPWHKCTLHTLQYHDLPTHSRHTCDPQIQLRSERPKELEEMPSSIHSPTVCRNEMASIKEGIVRRLGQVYEGRFIILHALSSENEIPENRDSNKQPENVCKDEKRSKLLPGKVKFLRAIFEDSSHLPVDHVTDS